MGRNSGRACLEIFFCWGVVGCGCERFFQQKKTKEGTLKVGEWWLSIALLVCAMPKHWKTSVELVKVFQTASLQLQGFGNPQLLKSRRWLPQYFTCGKIGANSPQSCQVFEFSLLVMKTEEIHLVIHIVGIWQRYRFSWRKNEDFLPGKPGSYGEKKNAWQWMKTRSLENSLFSNC